MSILEPTREPLTVLFSARTDTGLTRTSNEDNFLVDRRLRLHVVCDGLGGHQSGEVASATAVNMVREGVLAQRDVIDRYEREGGDERELLDALRNVALLANRRIHERGLQNATQRGMGTTLSLLLFAGERGFIAHVGDTRIYRLRDGQMFQLTEDHSLVTEMRRGLHMTNEQIDALDGRLKNQITRAVGVHEAVEVDVFSVDVQPLDRFLLCSDGLHGLVPDAELATLMGYPELALAASRLVDRANAAGGRDNITAIVVEVARPISEPQRGWPVAEVARTTPLFQGLGDAELAKVLEGVTVIALGAGESLVRDAMALPGLFLVLEGELQVVRGAEVVTQLRRGDCFGEDALLYDRAAGATVLGAAHGATLALVVRAHFEALQRGAPQVAMKLALVIARTLARKLEAAAREGGALRLLFRDPGAMTRPMPRPMSATRVLADTEPEPMRVPAASSTPAPPPTAVLRRPRGADRRAGNAVTQTALPQPPVVPQAPTKPAPGEDRGYAGPSSAEVPSDWVTPGVQTHRQPGSAASMDTELTPEGEAKR